MYQVLSSANNELDTSSLSSQSEGIACQNCLAVGSQSFWLKVIDMGFRKRQCHMALSCGCVQSQFDFLLVLCVSFTILIRKSLGLLTAFADVMCVKLKASTNSTPFPFLKIVKCYRLISSCICETDITSNYIQQDYCKC